MRYVASTRNRQAEKGCATLPRGNQRVWISTACSNIDRRPTGQTNSTTIEGCEGDVWILCVLKLDWHPGTKLVVIMHEQNNLTRESRVLWCWQTRAIFDGQHRCLAIHAILQVHREIIPKFCPVMLIEDWRKMLKKNIGCWCQTYVLLAQRKFPFLPSISGPCLPDTCCDIDFDCVATTEF
jgi:hypothetical protein